MLIILYGMAVIIVALLLLALLFNIRRPNPYFLLSFVFVLIANCGFLCLSLSQNAQEAILANKMICFGGVYLPLLMFLTIADFCKRTFPRWFVILLLMCSTFVMGTILTIGYSELYYVSVTVQKYMGVSYLEKVYGPAHNLYPFLLFSVLIASIVVVFHTMLHKKNVPRKTTMILLFSLVAMIVIYVVERLAHWHVELLPYAYVVVLAVYYSIVKEQQTYELSSGILSIYEQLDKYCYFSFSTDLKLMNCNDIAVDLFPEIKDLQIGSARYDKSSDIYKHIVSWLKELMVDSNVPREKTFIHAGRDFKCNVSQIISNSQKLQGYVVELVDETQQQQHMREMLETMDKLKAAEEAAVAANQSKSEFLASMSHEIRTPINAVLGMDTMILRESTEDTIKEYAMHIDRAGHTLLYLINDILDFSKIEAGKMELVEAEYPLGLLISDVVNMIDVRAKDKELQFEVEVEEDLPNYLFGDFARIRQILINFLSNAIKYTEHGKVLLHISETKRGMKDIILHIQVSDTGVGIKEEDMSKLFVGFERLDTKKNRHIEGSGLGLAITKRLIDMMHGEVWVDSEYGKGTTFTLLLPQKIMFDDPIGDWKEYIKNEIAEEYEEEFVAPEMKVLVVDDNRVNRVVFVKLLKQTRMQITEAESGEKCLELIRRGYYDIIFLDHFMPNMDGIETLEEMNKMEDNLCKDTPVVALTANAIEGSREMYLEHGFSDYLSKPIQYQELIEILAKYRKKED